MMRLGMLGLGRMGASMAARLARGGHECVAYDRDAERVRALAGGGIVGVDSPAAMVAALPAPRIVWMMVPAGVVDAVIADVEPLLAAGDVLIDGGNSHYHDDIVRARRLGERGIRYLDVGTSGGVWGGERGYCLMIGGDRDAAELLTPVFAALAPGAGAAPPTPGRTADGGTAEQGFLYCGPAGAGHFVKMVHNGIEYGLMAAYAEGFDILRHANVGNTAREHDAETTPLRHPEHFQYDFALGDIAELWRRGSVISSWLLDLAAIALGRSPGLDGFAGRVSDSGEGRWAVKAAVDASVPVPVLSSALYERFSSRGEAEFADRLLSAMRFEFGGHVESGAPRPQPS
jgi:6-phosphogluconate dehydrogenase